MSERIRIGELADRAAVSRDTIRFYERAGLLPKPRRTATRHRVYEEDAAEQIRFIRRAQNLGLTLDDIRQLIELQAPEGAGVPRRVLEILNARLESVEMRIANFAVYRDRLKGAIAQAGGQDSHAFFAELGADDDHSLTEA
jgi:MerR family copper efflux transcriptional regulator